jgi:uncharacterized protein YidB (DUF937 family)
MDELANVVSQLGSATSDAGATDPAAALSGLQQAVQQEGGIDGLLGKLRAAGLGDKVDSWVGTGQNQPITPEALSSALGPETVQKLSAGSGLDVAKLLPLLAAFLPQIVDMLTPNGQVPAGGLTGQGMPDIGGLLGGILGGGGGTAGGGGQPDIEGMLGGLLGGSKGR